jgi:hypothetical protein
VLKTYFASIISEKGRIRILEAQKHADPDPILHRVIEKLPRSARDMESHTSTDTTLFIFSYFATADLLRGTFAPSAREVFAAAGFFFSGLAPPKQGLLHEMSRQQQGGRLGLAGGSRIRLGLAGGRKTGSRRL